MNSNWKIFHTCYTHMVFLHYDISDVELYVSAK